MHIQVRGYIGILPALILRLQLCTYIFGTATFISTDRMGTFLSFSSRSFEVPHFKNNEENIQLFVDQFFSLGSVCIATNVSGAKEQQQPPFWKISPRNPGASLCPNPPLSPLFSPRRLSELRGLKEKFLLFFSCVTKHCWHERLSETKPSAKLTRPWQPLQTRHMPSGKLKKMHWKIRDYQF